MPPKAHESNGYEPDQKKFRRKDSVEPLDDRGSPLPELPEELKYKQEKLERSSGLKQSFSPSPPPQTTGKTISVNRNGPRYLKENGRSIQEIIAGGNQDPLQIIQLIRDRKDVGFLYMAAAVPRSSIEYNPYNLK